MVDTLLVQDYIYLVGSTRKRLVRTFLQGFVAGLAGIIGATLGVALLIFLLSQFGQIPGLGHAGTQYQPDDPELPLSRQVG